MPLTLPLVPACRAAAAKATKVAPPLP